MELKENFENWIDVLIVDYYGAMKPFLKNILNGGKMAFSKVNDIIYKIICTMWS